MLIKLTGHITGQPVLVESGAIVTAEETTDTFRDDKPYTKLLIMAENQHTSIGVKETCDEILEEITDSEDGLL